MTAARRRLKEAEEALRRAESGLEAASAEAARRAKAAAEEEAEDAEAPPDPEDEDFVNGTNDPSPYTVLWSATVKCEPGVIVLAQYGTDEDELWFRGTIVGVHRDDFGQWVDVEYDDGDKEEMKPIKRVRALDSDSSDEESDDDEEEG